MFDVCAFDYSAPSANINFKPLFLVAFMAVFDPRNGSV